jgi:hypothetical protein
MHDLLLKAPQQAEGQAKPHHLAPRRERRFEGPTGEGRGGLRKALGITEDSPVAAKIDGGVS